MYIRIPVCCTGVSVCCNSILVCSTCVPCLSYLHTCGLYLFTLFFLYLYTSVLYLCTCLLYVPTYVRTYLCLVPVCCMALFYLRMCCTCAYWPLRGVYKMCLVCTCGAVCVILHLYVRIQLGIQDIFLTLMSPSEGLPLETHRKWLRTYHNSFQANDIVNWLIVKGFASTRSAVCF